MTRQSHTFGPKRYLVVTSGLFNPAVYPLPRTATLPWSQVPRGWAFPSRIIPFVILANPSWVILLSRSIPMDYRSEGMERSTPVWLTDQINHSPGEVHPCLITKPKFVQK